MELPSCWLPQVYKGRRKCTGQITAMKFIMKHGKSEKDIKSLRQEIEILRQLRHEHIIQMLDVFETKTDFCVVTGQTPSWPKMVCVTLRGREGARANTFCVWLSS
jgi:serine/threonine protein kinase